MAIQATNNFVYIVRDEAESQVGGLIIPETGKVKPHKGVIFSVGEMAKDPKIKKGKGKIALFHRGVGFEIEYEDKTYLVLMDNEIIGVDEIGK